MEQEPRIYFLPHVAGIVEPVGVNVAQISEPGAGATVRGLDKGAPNIGIQGASHDLPRIVDRVGSSSEEISAGLKQMTQWRDAGKV